MVSFFMRAVLLLWLVSMGLDAREGGREIPCNG